MVDISSHKCRIALPTVSILIVGVSICWLSITASTANTAVPTFAPASNFSAGTNPHAVCVADFNSDARADIAIANRGSANVSIRLGDGAGGFGAVTNFSAGTNPVSVAVGDFNGDGKVDLVVANSGLIGDPGSVSILLGDGTGSFGPATNLSAGTHPVAVAVADFNGDSKSDLAVANLDSNTISILIGNGLGGFSTASNFGVGNNPRSLAIGDFNKDNKLDLVVANSGSNNVSVLLGNGSGGFAAAINFGVGTVPFSVAVGDFNADTKPDIVTANNTSNDVSVLLGDGGGGFAAVTSFAAGTNPYAVVVGDFYGDGKVDVAVANSGSGNVSVLLGSGSGSLGTATNFVVGTDPRVLTAGDINGDSKPDLVVPNFGSSNISLLLNTSIVTAVVSGTVKDTQNNPIAGVTVEAINPSNQQVVTSSVSDASGHYSQTVPVGTYNLKATPPQGSEFTPVTIANLSVVDDLVQDLTLAREVTVQLSGRVTDRDGNPFPNVTLLLTNTDPINHPSTTTDGNGNYSLRAVPATYTFSLNYALAIDPSFNGGTTLVLAQDTVRDVVIQNRILSGTIRDTSGTPIPNVTVKGCLNNSSFSGLNWSICNTAPGVKSDANGFYRMTLFPGSTTLDVVPPQGSLFGQTSIQVSIQGDTTRDITLNNTTVELRGRVTDRDGNPYSNVTVALTNTDPINHPSTTTDGNGNYSLRAEPATYTFSLNYALAIDPSFNASTTLALSQDTVRDIVIQNRILSGTIRDTSGTPIPNVTVKGCLNNSSFSGLNWSICNTAPGVKSDANGFYRMTLFPGSTTLDVVPLQNSGFAQTAIQVDILSDTTRNLTLQAPTHTIRGRITDANLAPIVGVSVMLTGSQSAISTTDGNGNYIFLNVTEGGNYTITPSRTSYSFAPPSASFSNLNSDQTANFTGTLVTFNVGGRVRDPNLIGVAGVTVTLSGATTSVTQTSATGDYQFIAVAAFTNYSIKPSKSELTFLPPRSDIVNLSSNQTVDFTAAVQPTPTPTPPLDEDFGNTQRNPDKFNFGSLSTDPTAFDPLVSVQQQNGQLKITPRANAFGTHYNGYTTVSAVDVNTSTPSVEVVQTASEARTLFSLGSDVNNNFGFLVQSAAAPTTAKPKVLIPKDATALLIFQITISGQLTALSIPYDPVAHRYWRFRYDPAPNALLFETSPDNTAWTVQHSVVLQRSVTPMAIELSSGTSTTTTNPGTAVFDNFHLGDKFNISGQVKTSANAPVSGVTVSLTGSFARTSLTDANGNYAFAQLDAGGNYNVTANLSGYTFSPVSQIFNSLATNKTADFVAALNGPSPTPSPTPGVPTPAGSTVEVQSNGVHITFAQVTAAGMTTVTAMDPASMGQLPGGYFLSANGVGFDITTTASYLPPVDICFGLPAATDAAVFSSLAVLHNEGGQLIDRTTSRNFNSKNICGRVNSLSPFLVVEKTSLQFNASSYSVPEGAGSVTITVTRLGHLSTSALVNFGTADGTAEQRSDYTAGAGTIAFSAGETTKTFEILVTDDLYVEGNETLTVSLSSPTGGAISGPDKVTLTITDNDTTTATTNPLDNADAQFFVRAHYYDFLSRAPDPGGLGFWAGTITQCGSDQTCLRNKRIDASNAFFYELEFQQTGAYVFRVYRVAFGNNQPFPNPDANAQFPGENLRLPGYEVFARDRAQVVGGASLSQSQLDFANAFVQRQAFVTKYPASLATAAQFVDAVLATILNDMGVDLSAQRNGLISLYNAGGRGAVIYRLADDNLAGNPINNRPLIDAEYNRAFVATQYFGYLRRDPDIGGFLFWLGQVSGAGLRDVERQHAMVCSFITSGEYQQRFSPVATHGNSECPH